RKAYEAAAAIPDVLDHLYCYCYCAEHHGHKSLRTCFTDGHGSGCDICMNEALLARKMHAKGYSIKEIRDQIDKEFYEPYN
ncbi:MAG: CYCXC family (seleno)protein, partial [Nitrospira sp.]|nr:CYCXC family (seleno)protein [Nitrospira sp.]